MKLEVGKYYKTRDGRKVGPIKRKEFSESTYDFYIDDDGYGRNRVFMLNGKHGSDIIANNPELDIISEWPSDSPVRTVTRKEIVPGVYGVVSVHNYMPDDSTLYVALVNNISHKEQVIHASVGATELRAAAATLVEIADALEDGKDE